MRWYYLITGALTVGLVVVGGLLFSSAPTIGAPLIGIGVALPFYALIGVMAGRSI